MAKDCRILLHLIAAITVSYISSEWVSHLVARLKQHCSFRGHKQGIAVYINPREVMYRACLRQAALSTITCSACRASSSASAQW